ncbi:unnamed protein product [Didymodactylos carnosus]|uniref:Uncharacterized protein n=2 Tax=Didymodactylos carnosus TaxID=1234261 RepID=A0A814KWS1_9BILA|nr:unnamed protein product [Didymodactylos carnosus]CAF3826566.1 unnamed protein product [Didymodactylos carnosus]
MFSVADPTGQLEYDQCFTQYEVKSKGTVVKVSRITASVRKGMVSSFIPFHIGLSHINRKTIIQHYTKTSARELIADGDDDTAILVADSTYNYIQVSNA